MAITLPDARQLPDEILEALRLRALRGCELGFAQVDLADLLGVTPKTVNRWWKAYTSKACGGLRHARTGRPVGSGRILNDEQARRLQNLIDNNCPDELGIACPLWSRRAVRDLIRNELGIKMPVRTVGEYLKRWGYTAKRPRRHSKDQDPEEVRDWLEEMYPLIEAQAREEDASIYWGDEVGVAADEYPQRGYARKGTASDHERAG
jgi:transposase